MTSQSAVSPALWRLVQLRSALPVLLQLQLPVQLLLTAGGSRNSFKTQQECLFSMVSFHSPLQDGQQCRSRCNVNKAADQHVKISFGC